MERGPRIQDQFVRVGKNREMMNSIARPSLTFSQNVWRKFKQNKSALFCCVVVIAIALMSILAPKMVPYDPNAADPLSITQSFSAQHWFGTDDFGRDLWARTWLGTRISLLIGFSVGVISKLLGAAIGGLSGYIGGKLDTVIMGVINILYAIPQLIIVILITVVMGKSIPTLIFAMVFYEWMGMARIVRGQVLVLKESEFVTASRLLGAKSKRVIMKDLIPNTMSLIIVNIIMAVPAAIFMEAFMSFIGLGVKPPDTSLGQLANTGAAVVTYYPWELIVPTILIAVLMISLNTIGRALNDALDPREGY
ncbi:MAG TPA: diguanylate cyclase [Ruminococcaceae bacterium]|nr:diguanylate cyclase [Oscillospiraceae bacterium]